MQKIVLFVLLQFAIFFLSFAQKKEIYPVDINADQINYLQQESKVIAKGNVKITYKDITLFCDEAEYDANKNTGLLKGNIKIHRENATVYTDSIIYDFNTQDAKMFNSKIESSPIYGKAKDATKVGKEKYILEQGYITTCNLEKPHYKLTAKKITIYPQQKVIAKNMFLKVGNVPVFYFPYYSHSLKDTSFPIQVIPGKNSKWGYYVLNRYRYNFNQQNRGKVLFDWYEERGLGFGLTHKKETANFGDFLLNYYSLNDELYKLEKKEVLFDKYPERQNIEQKYLENNRYRGQLFYSWQPNSDFSIKAEFNKFSDEFFVKDFFYREYEIQPKPISYVLADYSLDGSSLSLLTQKRFNPFFEEVEYLPQLEYNIFRKNISASPFYFESKSTLGKLNYKYAYSKKSFDTFRLHSQNALIYSEKINWLSINPYAKFYSTFYSKGLEEKDLLRVAPEVGTSFSTKLNKVFDKKINLLGISADKFLHIITPIVSYSYIFPPNVEKTQIYQFDAIDNLTRDQKVKFTLENKLKAKKDKNVWDFIYFSPSVEYSIKKYSKGSYFDTASLELEFYPKQGLSFVAENKYDFKDRALSELNVDMSFSDTRTNKYSVSVGQRYLRHDSWQATSNFTYKISQKLQFKNYLRYEYKDDKFKEQQYAFRLDLHCWWLDLGLNVDRQKDFTFWFAFILKDFPDVHIGFDKTFHGARESY